MEVVIYILTVFSIALAWYIDEKKIIREYRPGFDCKNHPRQIFSIQNRR